MKLVVPSSGSMIHWYSDSLSERPDSSARIAWSGEAVFRISRTASSDALSTSVTKSLCCFLLTWIRSRSSEARLMICPARRAALTAMLSMGCMSLFPCADAARRLPGSELNRPERASGHEFRRRRRIGEERSACRLEVDSLAESWLTHEATGG